MPEFVGCFELTRRIDRDAIGEVHRSTWNLGVEKSTVGTWVWRLHEAYQGNEALETILCEDLANAARLEHENAARVIEIGRQDGRLHCVREWIPGIDLARAMRWVRNGQASPPSICLRTAVEIVQQLFSLLATCHGMKETPVVHGRIASQRIILSSTGTVKLVGFGFARAFGHCQAPPDTRDASTLHPTDDVRAVGRILSELIQVVGSAVIDPSALRQVQRVADISHSATTGQRGATAQELVIQLEKLRSDLGLTVSAHHLGRVASSIIEDIVAAV